MATFRPWASVLDRWAAFDFKPKFTSIVNPAEIPMWVPEDDQRRLRAYSMLDAYTKNKARIWMLEATTGSSTDLAVKDRREYGDPSLLVKTNLASLLGDDWEVTTEGALGELEEINQEEAASQQKFIEEWAEKEKFTLKILENEEQAIKFGDGVYALGFDEEKDRVRLNVYDPGFYFPQFDDRAAGSEDFPEEVWIAWEFEEDNAIGQEETFVRRLRWWIDEETETCWMEDAIWRLENAVADVPFSGNPYDVIIEQTDLEIDFIPVVHIPNTVALQEHFGESILSDVLQVIDDIQSVDTDLQAAAATTGSPPIAITGMGDDANTSYGPGTVLRTGDGNATLLDTSRSLDALVKLKDALLERLAVNSQTPESLLGRVKPNEVPSGIALTLSFTPHSGMIKRMRLVRDHKYRLLFKFVIRMSRVNGVYEGSEEEFVTKIQFGSFLPADAQEAMLVVTQLLEAKAISLETAVKYLVERGYPISDWVTEIDRITERDFEGAQQVLAITGNPELAAKRLGIDAADVLSFEDEEEPDLTEE